jgi:heat shock protein HslJ
MMTKLSILTVLLLLALSGCLNNIAEKKQDGSDMKGETALLNKLWELQSFGSSGAEKQVLPDTKVTLQFGLDDRITGDGGCNKYFASYKIGASNTLSIGSMGSTLMYCERSMEQEQEYFKALGNVSTFALEQNRLQLFYNEGQGVLNFAISKG